MHFNFFHIDHLFNLLIYLISSADNPELTNKLCIFISLHRSPSQPTDIFDQFADNLELTFDKVANYNQFLIVVLSDFM